MMGGIQVSLSLGHPRGVKTTSSTIYDKLTNWILP